MHTAEQIAKEHGGTRAKLSRAATEKDVDWWDTKCPCHKDDLASLGITDQLRLGIQVKCHAGCKSHEIKNELTKRGFILNAQTENVTDIRTKDKTWVEDYYYNSALGDPIFRVRRFKMPNGKKTFYQEHYDPATRTYIKGMAGVTRVLYKLQDVLAQRARGGVIVIVEGEKDANNLAKLGFVSTTVVGGCNSPWERHYTESLRGAKVIVVPDLDAPGRERGTQIAQVLASEQIDTRLLILPTKCKDKEIKDISDMIEAGAQKQQIADVIMKAPKYAYQPGADVDIVFPGIFPDTDEANAYRLITLNPEELYYNGTQKRWYAWDVKPQTAEMLLYSNGQKPRRQQPGSSIW